MTTTRKPNDWHARFENTKQPKTVVLHADFAGIKTGTTMLVGSPEMIAAYIKAIPSGETRSIARMRNELARKNDAQAMCPVSTAIFLRVVAEVSLTDLRAGKAPNEVVPFWRAIEPNAKITTRLTCSPDEIAFWRGLEQI
jgi:hypothetical protein